MDADATSALHKRGIDPTDDSFKYVWFEVSSFYFYFYFLYFAFCLLSLRHFNREGQEGDGSSFFKDERKIFIRGVI